MSGLLTITAGDAILTASQSAGFFANCGHIHETRTKELPDAKTYVEHGDFTDTPTVLDLATMHGEGGVSTLDAPPHPRRCLPW